MAVAPGRLPALRRRVYKFLSTGVLGNSPYWPNNIPNMELLHRVNKELVDIRVRRLKWGWIGPTLCKDEKCIARKVMEWNPLISSGRLPGRSLETCRRMVARVS